MGQDQHRIIIHNIFTQVVFFENFAIWNGPDHIRSLGIHKIYIKVFIPAVLFQKFQMRLCMVPYTSAGVTISSVALHNRSLNFLNHRPPKLRTEEILISLFSRMNLHSHFSGQLHSKSLIHLYNLFRGNFSSKVNLCLHIFPSLSCI